MDAWIKVSLLTFLSYTNRIDLVAFWSVCARFWFCFVESKFLFRFLHKLSMGFSVTAVMVFVLISERWTERNHLRLSSIGVGCVGGFWLNFYLGPELVFPDTVLVLDRSVLPFQISFPDVLERPTNLKFVFEAFEICSRWTWFCNDDSIHGWWTAVPFLVVSSWLVLQTCSFLLDTLFSCSRKHKLWRVDSLSFPIRKKMLKRCIDRFSLSLSAVRWGWHRLKLKGLSRWCLWKMR